MAIVEINGTPRKLNWKRQPTDPRDLLLPTHGPVMLHALPATATTLHRASPAIRDQGDLGSCHDDQTEVLTDDGWKLFADLSDQDLLATVSTTTKELTYEAPTRLIRFPYKGKMICGNNMYLDFKVTPDHKMLVRTWNQEKTTLNDHYEMVPAGDLGWYTGLMGRIVWRGSNSSLTQTLPGVEHKHKPQRESLDLPMGAWLRFLGLYMAEGTMLREKREGCYKIQIAATKDRERMFAIEIFAELGLAPSENLPDRFTFSNKRIFSEMECLGLLGVHAPQKFVPDFVFKQSAENIRQFLLGHFMGDGCEDNNGTRAHYTPSKQLADDLQRLIFLSGDESGISSRPPRTSTMLDGRVIVGNYPEYRVSVREKRNSSIERKDVITVEQYDGEVFCAEVPTHHTLVTRRNGQILISGNCTQNAGAEAMGFVYQVATGKPDPMFSRLFGYYFTRVGLEGYPASEDSGCNVRDVFKAYRRWGLCFESTWPYYVARFDDAPGPIAQAEALKHRALAYYACLTPYAIKKSISDGWPVIFGFDCFESLESEETAKTGIIPMPKHGEGSLGGHCMLIDSYDDHTGMFSGQNSWGTGWGDHGRFHLPYGYFTQGYASDAHTLRSEEIT